MSASLLQLAREHYNLLVVLAGVSVLGASAGIIGAFAVLRKRALTGDALSHAALPGLCLAFLILRERQLTAMLLGALASGIAGIAIIAALGRWTRVKNDAAIGIVLSVFFGLGVVLLKLIQNMEGVGSRAGLNAYIFGKTAGMIRGDVYVILAAALFCLGLIAVLYKEFQLVSFDADFARSLGWPVYGIDLLLMSLVAAAVVIGLPNVGVVLISALLIMPGAAARFWTDRLPTLLALAGALGFATGLVGTLLSAVFNQLPAGPIIVLVGSGHFLASLLLGWRRGAIARYLAQRRFERQWRERELLRTVYETLEASVPHAAAISPRQLLASGAWRPAVLQRQLEELARGGLLRPVGAEQYELTPAGRRAACEVARGYRLWEAFLTAYPEQAASVDVAVARIEDVLPAAAVAALTERLQADGRWPREEPAP